MAAVQRAVVQQFPNVSAIDLTLILQTLNTLVHKIAFAIRFMAFFTIAAGMLVLASAVLSSRSQRRARECPVTYAGGLAAADPPDPAAWNICFWAVWRQLTGVLLAVLASWALATWLFEVTFVLTPVPLIVALLLVSVLTAVTGMVRQPWDHNPTAVASAATRDIKDISGNGIFGTLPASR